MAKMARERALKEKRERKQQKKDAKKQAAAYERAVEAGEVPNSAETVEDQTP